MLLSAVSVSRLQSGIGTVGPGTRELMGGWNCLYVVNFRAVLGSGNIVQVCTGTAWSLAETAQGAESFGVDVAARVADCVRGGCAVLAMLLLGVSSECQV